MFCLFQDCPKACFGLFPVHLCTLLRKLRVWKYDTQQINWIVFLTHRDTLAWLWILVSHKLAVVAIVVVAPVNLLSFIFINIAVQEAAGRLILFLLVFLMLLLLIFVVDICTLYVSLVVLIRTTIYLPFTTHCQIIWKMIYKISVTPLG